MNEFEGVKAGKTNYSQFIERKKIILAWWGHLQKEVVKSKLQILFIKHKRKMINKARGVK